MPPINPGPGPTAFVPARRLVQITAAVPDPARSDPFRKEMLYGLCNDGTAWVLIRRPDGNAWRRLPPVPPGNEDLAP